MTMSNNTNTSSQQLFKSIQPHFFNDTLYFSKRACSQSFTVKMLAFLEEWLASTPKSWTVKHRYLVDVNNQHNEKSSFLIKNISLTEISPISKGKQFLLITFKVLATILVIPRLLAETIRFGLRTSMHFTIQ